MPIYEYRCQDCDTVFEKLFFHQEKEDPTCPNCGSKKAKRQFSTFGFRSASGSSCGAGCGSCASKNCSSCRH